MNYREVKPGESLSEFVDCYWQIDYRNEKNEHSEMQRCLPNGMIELIIHTNGDFSYNLVDGKNESFPQAYFVGIMSHPVLWAMPCECEMFGVRLKPEAVIQLFNEPLSDFFNSMVDAEAFMGSRNSTILSQIRSSETMSHRIFLIESFLHNRIAASRAVRNYFTESIRMIRSNATDLSIDDLSRKLYVGERQLQRSFKAMLGISPKHYQRIIRFHEAYRLAQQTPANWTDISYQFGYSDQSHFIRDFREFTGEAPARLFN